MPSFFEHHAQNAILASIIGSAVAIVVAIGTAVYTVRSNTVAQDRQTRIEQIAKFDQSTQRIIDAAQLFVSSINEHDKGLGPVKLKLRTAVASEINDTGNITRFFDKKAKDQGEQYQAALQEFNDVAQKTSSVVDMRPWAESFGRVLDNKALLSRELYTELGIDARS